LKIWCGPSGATARLDWWGRKLAISARSAFRLDYRPELDAIRAIAVVAVMLCHTFVIGRGADLLGAEIVPPVLTGGLFGVDIFFVLSGFLITSILVQELAATGRMDLKAFYMRRVLRLSPAMVLVLLAALLYLALFRRSSGMFDATVVLISALYISNFALIFAGLRLGMLTPTWSLSVEEQFYSIWPLTLTLLLRMSRKKVTIAIVSLVAVSMLVRVGFYSAYLITGKLPLFGAANHLLFARADGLMLGALVAIVATSGWLPVSPNKRLWAVLAWGALLALLGILVFGPIDYGPSVFYCLYGLTGILSALLITALIVTPTSLTRVLRLPPLVWTGKISYGLYLFHLPVFALLPLALRPVYATDLHPWITMAAAILISFGLAAASYHFIEVRFLKLKHRISQPSHNIIAQPARA
jgi:peptidoglycan/LPS O-acetylase OafA/YrhL